MEYTTLGNSGVKVSRICLGTWAIGGWLWGGADDARSISTIHEALDKGITFIDTAPVYGFGRAEEVVGRAIEEHGKRDSVIIATKVGLQWTSDEKVTRNGSRARILAEIDASLKRLQTDYVDLYQLHWPDSHVPIEETAAAMESLRRAGKVRALGVSNCSPAQMDAFRAVAPLHSAQPPYNLFERGIEKDVLPYAHRNELTVLSYGAICRGLLSGRMRPDSKFDDGDLRRNDPKFRAPRYQQYLAAVDALRAVAQKHGKSVLALAIRWLIDRDTVALWGARRPDQLDAVDEALGWKIGEAEMRAIDAILNDKVRDPVGPEFMAPP